MRFLLLYIRGNLKHRKGSYFLTFFSCLLSGLLICTSVFYLTLDRKPLEESAVSPYDMLIYSVSNQKSAALHEGLERYTNLILREEMPYVDLMPLYGEEIAAIDENLPRGSLNFALTSPDSAAAAFFAENSAAVDGSANGSAPTLPGKGEVYVSRHVYHYFDSHIRGDILTLERLTDSEGEVLKLKIKGVWGDLLEGAVSILTCDEELMDTLRRQAYGECSLIFCDYREGAVPKLYASEFEGTPLGELDLSSTRFGHRFPDLYTRKEFNLYTGDLAIALSNLFFALLCIVCTLKLKLENEAADYRRMKNLGLAPCHRMLLPLADVMPLSLPAFGGAFALAALLFTRLAPRGKIGLEANIYTYEFICTPRLAAVCAAVFFGMLLAVLLVLVFLLILRDVREDRTYVKCSSDFYTGARRFVPSYALLRMMRNKGYTLFFIFVVAFPLIVAGMYATSGAGRMMKEATLFADADYIITDATERMAEDIAEIPGVESLHRVRRTCESYALAAGELTLDAGFMELDAYTASQLDRWLSAGSFDEVMQTDFAAAAVDNSGRLSVGDRLRCDALGVDLRVAALLTEFPQDSGGICFFVGGNTLDAITKEAALTEELHVYLRPNITDAEYAALKRTLPLRLYRPGARAVNQRDASAMEAYNGEMINSIAAAMNLLICCIAVLSVFLLHTQRQLGRKKEFSILLKLGYCREELFRLMHFESLLPAAAGFGLFGILYGLYIGGINRTIRMNQAYQYSGFSPAWGEIFVIAAGIVLALIASDRIAAADEKIKRRKKHED